MSKPTIGAFTFTIPRTGGFITAASAPWNRWGSKATSEFSACQGLRGSRIEIEKRRSRLMRRSSILDPHSSNLNHQSSASAFYKVRKVREVITKLMERKVMIMSKKNKRWSAQVCCALLLVCGFLSATRFISGVAEARRANNTRQTEAQAADSEKFLFVWAGDQTRSQPDFLAVINFDEKSNDYGKVITTVPLPEPGASGNEPHHVGLSRDGKVLACGGLLSVLRGQREIFFFDVSNPRSPRLITSADPPLSAITDEFYPLPDGGFLVTMMGGAEGHAPGRVAEFNRQMELVAEHP